RACFRACAEQPGPGAALSHPSMTPPSPAARASALAPFRVRSFRVQWPADLAASWPFEMELLILGWYVLAATGSVQQLVIFGALAWLGSLFLPFFRVAGDRI